ncbi:MAG TPA: hypothetical protein VGM54_23380 [Chthoniobacter sp.]|jgi:hypothetical protein
MRFLCVLLVLIAGVAALVFFSPTFPGHDALVGQWQSLQNASSPAGGYSPLAPGIGNVATTRSLADRVLRPLNSTLPPNESDPEKTIADIRYNLASSQSSANANIAQALNLIHQALEERRNLVRMSASAAQPGDLDRVPGKWHIIGHPEQSVDRTALNRKERASYWAQTARAQWQRDSAAYRQRIDQLLAATIAGP